MKQVAEEELLKLRESQEDTRGRDENAGLSQTSPESGLFCTSLFTSVISTTTAPTQVPPPLMWAVTTTFYLVCWHPLPLPYCS